MTHELMLLWRVFTLAMGLGLILSRSAAQPKPGSELKPEAAIDEFVRSEMARQRVPGVAIAIVSKGKTTTNRVTICTTSSRSISWHKGPTFMLPGRRSARGGTPFSGAPQRFFRLLLME